MMRLRLWVVATALAACAGGEMEGQVNTTADVRVTSPDLVAVGPGIQVIADADEPVFYSDGYYYLYRDNGWLRSDNDRSGFARIDVMAVPERLRAIPQPRVYAHYRRNSGRAMARPAPVVQRAPQPQPQAQPVERAPMPMQQQPTPPAANPIPGHTAQPALPEDERQAPVLPSERDKSNDHDRDVDKTKPEAKDYDR